MSYDLFVFESASAPRASRQFLRWYDTKTDFGDGVDYYDPGNCTEPLRQWLYEIINDFPAMNGPHRAAEDWEKDIERNWADYTIGDSFIYATFGWNAAEEAHATAHALARKYGLGVFDTSQEPAKVTFPDGHVVMVTVKPWWKFW
jgi:hypothetical protein